MTVPQDIVVAYLAHPVAPTEEQIAALTKPSELFPEPRSRELATTLVVRDNLDSALSWLRWLVGNTDWAISAPWIPYVQALNDATSSHRERGLRDDCAMAARCDGIILVGGRISSGMEREWNAVKDRDGWVLDLLHLGPTPPTSQPETWSSWMEYLVEQYRREYDASISRAVASF
jgi:hypothetical protein